MLSGLMLDSHIASEPVPIQWFGMDFVFHARGAISGYWKTLTSESLLPAMLVPVWSFLRCIFSTLQLCSGKMGMTVSRQ